MRRAPRALLLAFLVLPWGSAAGTALRVAAGGVLGAVAGTGVTLGIVVGRARFQEHFIESTQDLLSWKSVPIPAGLVAGGAAGAAGGTMLASVAAGIVTGGAVGAVAGAGVGATLSAEPEDRWAGGVVGAALGVFAGLLVGLLVGRRRSRRDAALAILLGVSLLAGGCGGDAAPELVAGRPVPPDPGAVESVLFLIGDPGKARYRHYPIIPRVAEDVDAWAQRVGRDSAVTVLVLGDVVYPDGMHAPGTPGFAVDSARVSEQIDMVREPGSMENDARLFFMAGNHDWGFNVGAEGAQRLRNLGSFLDRVRERGANVDLVPTAGSGVPGIVDLGPHIRLILLDTAWWLFDAEPEGKESFVEGVATALATAGGRRVVIAAHHPFQSAGPHGGLVPFWQTFGVHLLLQRSGAMLQDLNSRPYAEMRRALGKVFREHGRPLVFVGGHEHSLQVIRQDAPTTPRYSLVSGSASKLTDVRPIPGTMFQASAPGFMMLIVRENGAVDLRVVAAPDRFLACPEDEVSGMGWETCILEGTRAFDTVYSARLAEPGEGAGSAPAGTGGQGPARRPGRAVPGPT